jgi:hypothetical protein
MAGNTLNVNASLQCPHGGSVKIVSTNTRVVAGAPIATSSDTFIVSGCPFQIPATPPIPSPCVSVRWVVSDSRVKVGGSATLSQASTGLCLNAAQVPQGTVKVVTTQTHVSSF